MRVVRWVRVASHAAIGPPSLMQGARARNSASERGAAAGFPPTADPPSGSNASAGQGIPQLPHQCICCSRWVDKERLALTAIGSPSLCAICHSMWQVQGAVKDTQITVEKEAELLETLFLAFELLRGR